MLPISLDGGTLGFLLAAGLLPGGVFCSGFLLGGELCAVACAVSLALLQLTAGEFQPLLGGGEGFQQVFD